VQEGEASIREAGKLGSSPSERNRGVAFFEGRGGVCISVKKGLFSRPTKLGGCPLLSTEGEADGAVSHYRQCTLETESRPEFCLLRGGKDLNKNRLSHRKDKEIEKSVLSGSDPGKISHESGMKRAGT